MGPLLSIRSARLEKWAVSHGGLRTGCLAAKEDGVTETRGDSPQSFSAGQDGHANVSLGLAAFVQRADIAQRVGDDSAAIVVRPVVGVS